MLQVVELPALELGPIAKVRILGESVVLPAAGLLDGAAAPHAGGTVEVEEDAGTRTAAVFQDEMAIEQDGFDLGEKAVIAVEVGPAGLHHADARFGKVMHYLHEPVRWRHEVGVEDGDELA